MFMEKNRLEARVFLQRKNISLRVKTLPPSRAKLPSCSEKKYPPPPPPPYTCTQPTRTHHTMYIVYNLLPEITWPENHKMHDHVRAGVQNCPRNARQRRYRRRAMDKTIDLSLFKLIKFSWDRCNNADLTIC